MNGDWLLVVLIGSCWVLTWFAFREARLERERIGRYVRLIELLRVTPHAHGLVMLPCACGRVLVCPGCVVTVGGCCHEAGRCQPVREVLL